MSTHLMEADKVAIVLVVLLAFDGDVGIGKLVHQTLKQYQPDQLAIT